MLRAALRSAVLLGLAGCVSLPPARECADEDGDGWLACAGTYRDCDDGDPSRHPGAAERTGDDVDQDCDGERDGGDFAVTASTRGDSVHAPGVTVGFDGDGGGGDAGLISLRGAGGELLTRDPDSLDRGVAVTRWPDRFSWRRGPASTFARPLDGPALVQVALHWDDVDASGDSLFTIWADGRIHRHEAVAVAEDYPLADGYLAAYVSLVAGRFDLFDWEHNPGGAPVTVPATSQAEAVVWFHRDHVDPQPAGFACARTVEGETLGVSVRSNAAAGIGPLAGVRLGEILRPTGVQTLGFAYDWKRETPVPRSGGPDYTVDSLLHVGAPGATLCEAIARRARDFVTPMALMVGPGTLAVRDSADADLDGDGYYERFGAYGVSAAGTSRVAITATADSASLALRIEDAPAADPVVTIGARRLVAGRDYATQLGGGYRWLVLRDGLAADTTVALEWP